MLTGQNLNTVIFGITKYPEVYLESGREVVMVDDTLKSSIFYQFGFLNEIHSE